MISNLIERLSSNWQVVEWLLTSGLSITGVMFIYAAKIGKDRLLGWFATLERDAQDNALERVHGGISGIQNRTDMDSACEELISGIDQWRSSQSRIRVNNSRISRSEYFVPIYWALSIGAFIARAIENAAHVWSGAFVVGAALSFAWLLWNLVPLAQLGWHNSLPTIQSPAPLPDNPAPAVARRRIRRTE